MALPTLRIAHLYPNELNIYGDRGNLLALYQRCVWRGLGCEITPVGLGQAVHPEAFDLYFMGGGQDTQQVAVAHDLTTTKAAALSYAAEKQAVFLGICGGYQLLGHYYQPHQGPKLMGLGLMNHHTVAGDTRFIGNVVINTPSEQTLVGFENHSGKTYLGEGTQPLGQVIEGYGNNGEDGGEGAQSGTLFGTYLHGALLPKNPWFADKLILLGLQHRYGVSKFPDLGALTALDDTLENAAHAARLQNLDPKRIAALSFESSIKPERPLSCP